VATDLSSDEEFDWTDDGQPRTWEPGSEDDMRTGDGGSDVDDIGTHSERQPHFDSIKHPGGCLIGLWHGLVCLRLDLAAN
jgi:hypothetical protein